MLQSGAGFFMVEASLHRIKGLSLIWRASRASSSTANVMLILLLLGVVVLVFLLISTGSPRRNALGAHPWRRDAVPGSASGTRQQALLQRQQQPQGTPPATQNSLWKDLTAAAPGASEATVPGRPSVMPQAQTADAAGRVSVSATPRPSIEDAPLMHLCRELVVPHGQECTLIVPRLPATGRRIGEVAVSDLRGSPVFNAKYGEGDHRALTLFSASQEEFVFGFCRRAAGRTLGEPPALTIYYQDGRQFGVLSSDTNEAGSSFTISTQRGCWLKFKGDLHLGNLNAMDEQSRLLAIAEPEYQNSYQRRVRIGPHVDAGLIALCMMSIDLLEHQALEVRRR